MYKAPSAPPAQTLPSLVSISTVACTTVAVGMGTEATISAFVAVVGSSRLSTAVGVERDHGAWRDPLLRRVPAYGALVRFCMRFTA